jgi:hypothetical protein
MRASALVTRNNVRRALRTYMYEIGSGGRACKLLSNLCVGGAQLGERVGVSNHGTLADVYDWQSKALLVVIETV